MVGVVHVAHAGFPGHLLVLAALRGRDSSQVNSLTSKNFSDLVGGWNGYHGYKVSWEPDRWSKASFEMFDCQQIRLKRKNGRFVYYRLSKKARRSLQRSGFVQSRSADDRLV